MAVLPRPTADYGALQGACKMPIFILDSQRNDVSNLYLPSDLVFFLVLTHYGSTNAAFLDAGHGYGLSRIWRSMEMGCE